MSLIHKGGVHILLSAFVAVIMIIAMVVPVLAQQGSQIQLTDFLDENSDCPDVAIDSNGNVHIVFEEDADSNEDYYGEIWYTMLGNDGNTLIDETMLFNDEFPQRKPAIGIDSQNKVHIVWQSDHGEYIAYTKLDPYLDDRDGDSANLATIEVVAATDLHGGAPEKQLDPRIAIDSNDNVHVVWENYDGDITITVAYMKLNSSGTIIVSYTNVASTSNEEIWFRPFIAVDSNNNPHISWNDIRSTAAREIYYAMLNGANGNHLIDATRITDDDDHSSVRSDIVVDGDDNVHVFWSEMVDDGLREIYYKKLDPGLADQDGNSASASAITVIDDTMVSSDDGWRSSVPQAAYQCGYIHVTWKDDRYDQSRGDRDPPADVFYMVLDTDGNVVVPETALTTSSTLGHTHYNADNVIPVAVDENGKAHVAWCDYRVDGYEIWYTSYQGPSCMYRPVGGEAYPVKTIGFIAPLIGLAIAATTGILVIRHRKSS